MAWSDTVARYRRSILGPFWTAGTMAGTSISLAFVFGSIFGEPLHEVLPYIMAGLVTWQIAALYLYEGPEVFIGQAGAIQNNALPTSFYLFRYVTRALITLAHNLVVLGVTLLVLRYFVGIHWQVIPGLILLIIFATFASGLAGLVAARFRDVRFMLPQLGQLLFFLTPIFWRPEAVSPERAGVYLYNPMYYMLSIVRDPLLGKGLPPTVWAVAAIIVAVTIAAYFIAFALYRRRLPFWL
ncbi:ABC transporter permease [Brevundimonas sp. 2R-24]|uniref:ABC transporter permease n=1 Tax=Peiella sedimenti TaxID=3061083 RepID=A0ABT8SKD0_9CAUL|nr:ABC transporter permease [Caulobacteraceae bacterium XZ-24]